MPKAVTPDPGGDYDYYVNHPADLFAFMRQRPNRGVPWGQDTAGYLRYPRHWLAQLGLSPDEFERVHGRMLEALRDWMDKGLVAPNPGAPEALDLCILTEKGRAELAREFFDEQYVAPPLPDVQA